MQGDVTRANLQALQFDGWYPIGQGWLDVQPLMRGIGPQTQDSTQHMEDAAAGPGLWNVGPTGVEDGKILVSSAMHSCEDFRWPVRIETVNCIEDATNDLVGFIGQTIAFEARRDDAIVLGPDGAKLIQIGIKSRILARKGANAPATPHILDRKSTRLNSSHEWISYAVFCLKKKKKVEQCATRKSK